MSRHPGGRAAARDGWLNAWVASTHWHNRGYRDFRTSSRPSVRASKQLRKEREQVGGRGHRVRMAGRRPVVPNWSGISSISATPTPTWWRPRSLPEPRVLRPAGRAHAEAIRVVFAHQRGKPVAMAFSLVAGDTLYGRYWGCLAEFRPAALRDLLLPGRRFAIGARPARFDAGAQGGHKLIRGFEPVPARSALPGASGLRDAVAQFLEAGAGGCARLRQEARPVAYR
ncbi:peptidogalycan biosysnthesis protein [Pseudomonas aeruginosa]